MSTYYRVRTLVEVTDDAQNVLQKPFEYESLLLSAEGTCFYRMPLANGVATPIDLSTAYSGAGLMLLVVSFQPTAATDTVTLEFDSGGATNTLEIPCLTAGPSYVCVPMDPGGASAGVITLTSSCAVSVIADVLAFSV